MNQELASLGDSLASDCVSVPMQGFEVCPICRGHRDEMLSLCDSCDVCQAGLGSLRPVVPMSLYAKPSAMRDRLRGYKDSDDASTRRRLSRDVAALVERFFIERGESLRNSFGSWDVVCVVPSTEREPPHPLVLALSGHEAGSFGPIEELLRRGTGETGHRKPHRNAFEPTKNVDGRRVLLLDDVFTTGARSQSAAHALVEAGATVSAIVVVARRINPDWCPEVAEWWERQLAVPFSWSA